MTNQDGPVASPCIGTCVLDPVTNLCEGCLRNVQEITDWTSYTDDQKRAVVAQLNERGDQALNKSRQLR